GPRRLADVRGAERAGIARARGALHPAATSLRRRTGGGVTDTLVFLPAWNEESNLPAVLDELAGGLPAADVLVVDDGSTDGTAGIARGRGAEVVSFDHNRGLREAIAAGYRYADEHDYAYCGRIDADGQHPVAELRRLLELVRSGACDVAVGSRFASG